MVWFIVLNATFNNILVISLRSQFYWWRKLEYPEKTTDLWQLEGIYEIFQLSFVLQVDTKCITDEIYFSFVTSVLNDWVKNCTDVLNFAITSLLLSSAHKYSIGDKLDCKVANWERKHCFCWQINDKHRAPSHYLCIDWKLVWLSLLKPPDLLSASPCGGQGRPLDWGRVHAKIRNAWSWTIVDNVFGDCHAGR